jgi:hypothetical protein
MVNCIILKNSSIINILNDRNVERTNSSQLIQMSRWKKPINNYFEELIFEHWKVKSLLNEYYHKWSVELNRKSCSQNEIFCKTRWNENKTYFIWNLFKIRWRISNESVLRNELDELIENNPIFFMDFYPFFNSIDG